MKQLLTGFALLLLLTAPALAVDPTSTAAPTETDLALLAEPPAITSLNHQERNFLDAIAEVENQYGPYHSHLPQHLMGLGINYQNRGQHEEAEEIFRRAMHVSRISEGLYSLAQLPMLERLIETTVAQGDWTDANDTHQYLFWLYKRNFDDRDPRMLPALLKLSGWHLNAYSLDDATKRFEHLLNAHLLYELTADLITASYGPSDLQLVEALRGLTVTNYYLASYQPAAKPEIEFDTGPNKNRSDFDEKIRQDHLILKSYSSGKDAIARIYEVYSSNPDAPPGAKFSAQVQLADWNLLFNRWQTALEQYQAAYRSMAATDEGRVKADEFFSRPVALPDLPLLKSSIGTTTDEQTEYVVVRFDVTPNGSTQNIEILETFPEDDTRNRTQVRRALKNAKFRPRFDHGAPVPTQQLVQRYVFTN